MRALVWLTLLLSGCDLLFPPDGAAQYAEYCADTSMCALGLTCSREQVCRSPGEPGTALPGEVCLATSQCAAGLVCTGAGQCAPEGDPGTGAHGDACAAPADCRAGLACEGDVCVGVDAPFWPGATCASPDAEAGAFRVFFEIPGDDPLADFYRLPFPNDARRDDAGLINLDGHPGPGALVDVVGDVVGNIARAVSVNTHAFGTNQAIFFRFSGSVDPATLTKGVPGQGAIALVDLTAGEDLGALAPFGFEYGAERTAYLCDNWLAVYPEAGAPLKGGHTYGVLISRDALDTFGTHAAQDPDFTAMLAASDPGLGRLTHPWQQYAPLRQWLASARISPDQLAAASVFTVQDPGEEVEVLREAIGAEPAPIFAGLALCGSDPDALEDPNDATRGCQTASDGAWLELQATVGLPQYQEGAAPYKDATDGGAIDLSRRLMPPVRQELVQVALSVPTGRPAPQAGWPLVIYAHSTGGNYTSALRDGISDTLSDFEVEGVGRVGFAVLGFDAPLHGPRAARSGWKQAWLDADPHAYDADTLFFNPLNPRAARDNLLQEAGDLWSLVKAAKGLDLDGATSPTGTRLRIDPDHIYFLGHGQGASAGVTFLAHEAGVRAAVLAGAGGLSIESMLHKQSPRASASALAVGLADPWLSRVHPILNLAQQLVERTDPVNQAGFVYQLPMDGDPARSVFQVFGVGDTYVPDSAQAALASALGLDQFTNGTAALPGFRTVTLPAGENRPDVTALVGTYDNTGDDAHFVLFDRPDVAAHLQAFFGSALTDRAPVITPL